MTNRTERPPFIASQGMRLLADTDRPERFLRAEYFRAGRGPSPAAEGRDMGTWLPIDRRAVAANRVQNPDGTACDLSRLAITTDAGVGKTITIDWLHAEINRPGSDHVALRLTFGQLARAAGDWVRRGLLPQLAQAAARRGARPDDDRLLEIVELLRAEGRLVLLFDALDQAPPDGSAVGVLREILEYPDWRSCRIVISGRPHALQRHWAALFDVRRDYDWRFVQVDEFDERQQRRFLGKDRNGRNRFDLIPVEARDILATPRVLEYLRGLPDGELSEIKTAADVYWRSINHLLKHGMQNSPEARRVGLAPGEPVPEVLQARSLSHARKLLGAIAFEMASTRVPRPGAAGAGGQQVPNFDGVPPNRFDRFKDRLFERLGHAPGGESRQLMERDLDCLAALNDFLAYGIFDTDLAGLDRILWRNRTLQEFFAAYWLAVHAHPDDARPLWDWIYLPEDPLTEEYYWLWRFVCEMPEDARDPETWVRAVEPLCRPGDGTPEGTKRSCEMIYRLWPALDGLADEGHAAALAVRDAFLGEFEGQILSGPRGPDAQQAARQFCDSFVEVPAGEFQMGTPDEKQGMSADVRQEWREHLDREGDPQERAEQYISKWVFSPSKQGQEQRQELLEWWTGIFRDRDLEGIDRSLYPHNETPEEPRQTVDTLLLSRWPMINAWYRLFDPGHGVTRSYYAEAYARTSAAADMPAIFVSWYDAWGFCLWARWDGRGCRLPREFEWEYAAKASTPWDWNYWWGDEFDATKCNADRQIGRTSRPDPEHRNPWGFDDMLGNVWEWCEDQRRLAYARDKPPDSFVRVLRGGSWISDTSRVRSAYRNGERPSRIEGHGGFRVARAKS